MTKKMINGYLSSVIISLALNFHDNQPLHIEAVQLCTEECFFFSN